MWSRIAPQPRGFGRPANSRKTGSPPAEPRRTLRLIAWTEGGLARLPLRRHRATIPIRQIAASALCKRSGSCRCTQIRMLFVSTGAPSNPGRNQPFETATSTSAGRNEWPQCQKGAPSLERPRGTGDRAHLLDLHIRNLAAEVADDPVAITNVFWRRAGEHRSGVAVRDFRSRLQPGNGMRTVV